MRISPSDSVFSLLGDKESLDSIGPESPEIQIRYSLFLQAVHVYYQRVRTRENNYVSQMKTVRKKK